MAHLRPSEAANACFAWLACWLKFCWFSSVDCGLKVSSLTSGMFSCSVSRLWSLLISDSGCPPEVKLGEDSKDLGWLKTLESSTRTGLDNVGPDRTEPRTEECLELAPELFKPGRAEITGAALPDSVRGSVWTSPGRDCWARMRMLELYAFPICFALVYFNGVLLVQLHSGTVALFAITVCPLSTGRPSLSRICRQHHL